LACFSAIQHTPVTVAGRKSSILMPSLSEEIINLTYLAIFSRAANPLAVANQQIAKLTA